LAEVESLLRHHCHELNNHLNSLMLRLSLLQLDFPDRAELGEIRAHVLQATESIQRIQAARHRCQSLIRPVDLSHELRELLPPTLKVELAKSLPSALPQILLAPNDLQDALGGLLSIASNLRILSSKDRITLKLQVMDGRALQSWLDNPQAQQSLSKMGAIARGGSDPTRDVILEFFTEGAA
jgi:hypothetical protein